MKRIEEIERALRLFAETRTECALGIAASNETQELCGHCTDKIMPCYRYRTARYLVSSPAEDRMTWFMRERQGFIHAQLWAFGQIRRADIASRFEVSIQIASADIAAYVAEHPDAIIYDGRAKCYVLDATPTKNAAAVSQLFDMAKAKIEEQREEIGRLKAEIAHLTAKDLAA